MSVPTGPEWRAMVADAAVEIWEAAGPGGMSWRRAHDAAEKAMLAALRAVTTEPCSVCESTGHDVPSGPCDVRRLRPGGHEAMRGFAWGLAVGSWSTICAYCIGRFRTARRAPDQEGEA